MEEARKTRFWERVEKTPTCWLWLGSLEGGGYGQFSIKGKLKKCHRLAYEMLVGRIPEGLVTDHLCRVRNCVNPEHLEIVTPKENTLRGMPYRSSQIGEIHSSKTHCPRGHAYSNSNTRYVAGRLPGHKFRQCRICSRYRKTKAYKLSKGARE